MLPVFLVIAWVFTGISQERTEVLITDPSLIVNQHLYADSINACGPASIFNLLKFGPKPFQAACQSLLGSDDSVRLRFLIERYFKNRRSVVFRGEQRWGVHGVTSADLVKGLNELLRDNKIPPLNASSLDREKGESDVEFLTRIHRWMSRSTARGVPPILSLRSYAVRRRAERNSDPAWEPVRHHFVVVSSLTKQLAAPGHPIGFEASVLDPNGAGQREVFIHLSSKLQPFRAMKGAGPGSRWLGGRPFLLVEAPEIASLRSADLRWSDRFLIVANFLIGDF